MNGWRPIRVRRVAERQAVNHSDFPWLLSQALGMRRRAVVALRDLLDAHGEVLPLATDEDVELFVFNARVVDALDEKRSSVIRFPESGRIMYMLETAFRESMVDKVDISRLPYRASLTYVSDQFVARVKEAGLTGLDSSRCGRRTSTRPHAP